MQRKELESYLADLLQVARFQDYCPNGLQVEGRTDIRKIVTGVSASFALLEAAVAEGADTILVHHGYFWKNESAPITGVKRRRLEWLLRHDLNLFAYHLPLDAHPTLGNNAQLGKLLGFQLESWFGEQGIMAFGRLKPRLSLQALTTHITKQLKREPLAIGDDSRVIENIAWCSGGAQGYMADAIEYGADAYLTGEISEHTVHLARESGVAFIAAGHHATERYGIPALGEHIAQRFGLEHLFIDIDNPA